MQHRHLNHQGFTLAAIDDIVAHGRLSAWEELRTALLNQPGIRAKVLRICNAYRSDPYAQRHHFWRHYAEAHPEAP